MSAHCEKACLVTARPPRVDQDDRGGRQRRRRVQEGRGWEAPAEERECAGEQPGEEWRLLEPGLAVEAGDHEVAGLGHLSRNLRVERFVGREERPRREEREQRREREHREHPASSGHRRPRR